MASDNLKLVYFFSWIVFCWYIGFNYLPSYMLEGEVPIACYIVTFVIFAGVLAVAPKNERED